MNRPKKYPADFKLQSRTCQCGCGAEFKVYPATSPCWFRNSFCAERAYHKGGTHKELAEKFYAAKRKIADANQGGALNFQEYIPWHYASEHRARARTLRDLLDD